MISITSITDKYILQPSLLDKHRNTLDWLSATVLWKRELFFFQKLLYQYSPKFTTVDDKKKIDHFQNLLLYYNGELIDNLSSRLRLHEKRLADTLQNNDESKTEYYKEHDELMNELETFSKHFVQFKQELFSAIEKVM
jgi:DUF438 domain-containing protein